MKVTKSTPRKASNGSHGEDGSPTTSNSSTTLSQQEDDEAIARGGVATPFPWKLHEMLEDSATENNEWIVSWQSHGRSFLVHKPKIFVEKIMPTYFNQSKFASFQRQLNLYGFNRLTSGPDKGAYYHEFFIRGQRSLCRGMIRQKIKGTKVRRTLAPEEEPNFYAMTNIPYPDHSVSALSPTGGRNSPNNKMVPQDDSLPPPLEMEAARARRESMTGKARAMKARHNDRAQTFRNVLQETRAMLCGETSMDFFDGGRTSSSHDDSDDTPSHRTSSSEIPSVSLVDSEESDSDESNPSVLEHSPSFESLPYPPPPQPLQFLPGPPLERRDLTSPLTGEPQQPPSCSPSFNAVDYMNSGDLLFFEGKPFHYLEHLESIPSVPATFKSTAMERDTLSSLIRADPKTIMSGLQ